MELITQELLALGHQRIAIFKDGAGESRDSHTRVELLRANLLRSGIPVPDQWVLAAKEDAREVISRLMAEPEPPTAIVCWHDRLAYGVLASCDKLGIQVPQQLSIVGYDGLHWPSSTRHISASVNVHQPTLARMAVRLLDDYINGYEGPLREEVLPVTFTAGTSLGPPSRLQRSNS